MSTLVRTVTFTLLLASWPTAAAPQGYQGAVRGTIRDATGVIPDAAVSLVDERTGLLRVTSSNRRGEYLFADVAPGVYRITASVSGYKTAERSGVELGTRAFLTIDILLEVGNLSEQITIEGRRPTLDTSPSSAGTLLDRSTIAWLPTPGRNVFFMAALTPTVVPTGDSQFVRQQDQSNSSLLSIGGGPRRNNLYLVDGVPIVDILNRATFIPSLEAVEGMRVQVSAYDAEVGRTSGGVFNVTARSGSNDWRGGALYQTRPDWAVGRLFFAANNDLAGPDTYYHLYGGSLGGPLVRNRTFFWTSTEGYRTATGRSTVLVLPTAAERNGDFSQSGVTIYDPLTTRPDPDDPTRFIRDPFPGNRIPPDRLNPVSLALLKYLPMPTAGKSRPAVADIVDRADQITTRITHRWSHALTTTGLYAWYGSMEPDARFYGEPLFENPADPGDGALVRRVHLLAVNTTWAGRRATVLHTRYGFNQFLDDNRPGAFDPSALGFAPEFLNAVPLRKFPGIGVQDYGRGGALLGDRSQDTATYYSHSANASVTTLAGRHTLKLGGEFRVTGVRFFHAGGSGGFGFTRDFTLGPNPNAPAAKTGDAFASFLLGYPSHGSISVGSPIDIYSNYWSGYAQDDVRVTSNLTLTLGVRYEFQQGLREHDNRMIVGWGSDTPFPVQVNGTRPDGTPLQLTGGLLYAGIDGAPTRQGDPRPLQFAPRVAAVYAMGERTSLRGGYGLFWAPSQGISADESGSGTSGYNRTTSYVATGANPLIPCDSCSLANPFPQGIHPPIGNSLGRLTGVGGTVGFIDPRSRMGHVHRYSLDVQRELASRVVVGVAYLGARGVDLGGGIGGGGLNINQLDPKYFALGTALQEPVPNPFFGTPLGVGILSGATVARGQLLRPYPQFDGVFLNRSNLARSRYDALVVTADRRLAGGWALYANYTWSRAMDSQYSESNFFAGGSGILDNHDVDREYGLSVLDAPHRLNIMGVFELPFGHGRRWMNGGGFVDALVGGWTISAVGSYQSGFPVSVLQSPNNSHLFGSGQRPNIVPDVNPRLSDDPEDSYDPSCGCIRWLNPAAWSQAPPFTFGNAPRTDGRVRTPMRRNWDVAIQKAHRVHGKTITVRAELINALDFADLRGPSIVFGDASFGQIRDAAGFPRMLQVTTRLQW